jgi:hypothetical protein
VKALVALAAMVIAAGCNRGDDAGRRSDTSVVTPPVGVSPSEALACGVTGNPVLTDQGIGDLKVGRPVAGVTTSCEVVSDSRERGAEGMMERVLVTRIAGEVVRSIVNDERIWRIELTSPRFTTSDSLGVDTPLRQIAARRGAGFFPGEGGVYGFLPDHCGLSFRFSIPLRPPKGGQWTARSIAMAHGDAAVDRILVTRCAQ